MKKFFPACIALFLLALDAVGQKNEFSRQKAIGLSFLMNDFLTPDRIRTTSLNSVISDKKFARFNQMSPGLAINYFQGMGNHVDFAGSLSGSFMKYPMPNKSFTGDALLLEGSAMVNLKMTSEKYWVQPYISAGIAAHKYRSYYGATLPLGLGLKVNFFDEAHLYITSTYRVPVTTETANYHLQHGIGIAGTIGGRKNADAVIPTPPPPPDSDGDGVSDPNDNCPNERGVARYGGCPIPDSDKDGINDEIDKCPSVPGLARYEGCPVPDSDKDGLNDEEDKCPDAFGVARYNGCPVPDTDKDGVNDENDKCIELAGPEDNFGCPFVAADIKAKADLAAKNIVFVGTTSKLNTKSNKGLDELAKIMKGKTNLYLATTIQTKDGGKEDKNYTLAESRATTIKKYLVAKGIAENRIMTMGQSANMNKANLELSYYK